MILKKLSMLFFIVGSLFAIFSGTFEILYNMEGMKILFLLVLGFFIGLFNISEKQELRFLISTLVYIVVTPTLVNLLGDYIVLDTFADIMINFIYLFGSAALVVAVRSIIEFASETEATTEEEYFLRMIENRRESLAHRIWDMLVFLSVAILFIIIILRLFFDTWRYDHFLTIADYSIYLIFLVDLVFLYMNSRGLKDFFWRNWLDIIAVIPLGSAAQLAKLGRAARLVKIFTHSAKIGRSSKALSSGGKVAKYFSNESGFNRYILKSKKKNKQSNTNTDAKAKNKINKKGKNSS